MRGRKCVINMQEDEFSDSGSEQEEGPSDFPLHDAAQAGNADLLRQLLTLPPEAAKPAEDELAGLDPILARYVAEANAPQLPDPDQRDSQDCTPLHVALLYGQLEAARALLECGASVEVACEGSPPLHVAACVAAHAHRRQFAEAAVAMLLRFGADPYERDDNGRTALHWAAQLDFEPGSRTLLTAAAAKRTQVQAEQEARAAEAAAAAAAAAAAGGDGVAPAPAAPAEEDGNVPPPLEVFQDKHGCTALHLAARQGHTAASRLLLEAAASGDGAPALARTKNKAGQTALHLAALAGSAPCAALLAAAAPQAAAARTKLALTAADLAERRRHAALAAALRAADPAAALAALPPTEQDQPRTLLVAPPECLCHYTCPAPITRAIAAEAPPENMERLTVLTQPGWGILRTSEFTPSLRWDEASKRAALGDILRVHDWNYVRRIQMVCDSLPDKPDAIGQLDGDTAVSRRTFAASLAAAGSVCAAVDEVMAGKVANAFCAVRPPGHHAGPLGVVTNANDPNGSHGFCLFNNAAVGAAYAMNVYRHAGVKRVAIVDFDVHHGNGTEACVTNTIPSSSTYKFRTPYSEGTQSFAVWKPWLDSTDKECIFFASVQGYGPKAEGYPSYVYPGSGATCDTKELADAKQAQEAAAAAASAAAVARTAADAAAASAGGEQQGGTAPAAGGEAMEVDGGGVGEAERSQAGAQPPSSAAQQQQANGTASAGQDAAAIEEDPDGEFGYTGGQVPPLEGPRVIDIGIPGFGPKPALWRRSWRDKILPALAKFQPDIIFICAGFDAHRKDEINFRYIGVTERDYEWLTEQLVAVANRCCGGRIVSVLEGGYRIQGALVSAFARSVAAHVKALAEPNAQHWDPADAKAEREHEKKVRAEAEAKRQAERLAKAKAREAALAARLAAVQAARAAQAEAAAAAPKAEPGDTPAAPAAAAAAAPTPAAPAPTPAAPAAAATADDGEEGDGGRKRRRRGSSGVDYVALNKQLEAEAAAKRAGGS
ncbi:histone deacetylase [Micractinium conductrix]|uniref:Histone deacetylase n=1 Tax=Micractinium conductrix TaxID=554055 RepID=A0A2P6VD53_9CHLO|nr:histone deacetylase [Micractinium conductrix]|eukprot:PSC72014.1 histone deacetylase [Micractinium conductrix]